MAKGRISFANKDGKKKKKTKRDEENILSKDIDVEEEMKFLEKMNEKSGIQREMSNINYSKSFIKNLKFKPQKYKGTYLPYHLRWIFGNSVKTNEISLVQEVKALETEIVRLKQMKILNREYRREAGFHLVNPNTRPCPCCRKQELKNHFCTHAFCDDNCVRKKLENQFNNTFSNRTIRPTKGLYDEININHSAIVKKSRFVFATKKETIEEANENIDNEKKQHELIFSLSKVENNRAKSIGKTQ